MASIRGVLLDVDGTLVDSNDAHARSWVEAFADHAIEVPYEKVRPLVGMGGDKLLPLVTGLKSISPKAQAISRRRQEIFMSRYLPSLAPFPGARELLERMHEDGLKLVVASSAKDEELKPLLKICGADGLIEDKTSADDADHSKPDPDIVQAALKKIALPPGEAIMLGDTPYDIEAARKAGVPVIALRCGGWDAKDLADALAIYDGPADLLTHYDSSPLAKR